MKKIYLTSIGYKILAIICTIGMFSLTFAVSFLVDKVHVIAIVFSVFVSLFCLFALFISFNHKIMIKDELLIIKQIRTVKINFGDILEIKGNETFSNDNVIFIHTNEKTYRLNGFNSLLGQKRKLLKTNEVIIELIEYVKLIKRT